MAEGTNQYGIDIRNLSKIFGPNAKAMVELVRQGATKATLNERHRHVLGLRNINISMPAGGIQVIMGLSGSGKSTLIRHINRLVDPTDGEVLVGGEDVVKMNQRELREFRRHKTAMVFQKFALLPHRTILENTVYGLEVQGVPRARQVEEAMRWIERVGLSGFEARYPNQLSGGMQQRVAIARAFAENPRLLLMDEPFGALDEMTREYLQTELARIAAETGAAVVFVTHSIPEAVFLADRVVVMSPRPGRITDIIETGFGDARSEGLRESKDFFAKVTQVRESLHGAPVERANER